MQKDEWLAALKTKNSFWMYFVPLVLVATMAGALFYIIRRHRRISNSFSRFTNSHYDTKNGVRIGDAIEEDDHHHNVEMNIDVPRFDDDEPLVLR